MKLLQILMFLVICGLVLIMVSAFVPKRLLPYRCNFGETFECYNYTISYGSNGTDGKVTFFLKNAIVESVQVDSVKISKELQDSYFCKVNINSSYIWQHLSFIEFASIEDCDIGKFLHFPRGKEGKIAKAHFFITLVYHKVGSPDYKHEAIGEIFAPVETSFKFTALQKKSIFIFSGIGLFAYILIKIRHTLRKQERK